MALAKIEPTCPISQKVAIEASKLLKTKMENMTTFIKFTITYLVHWDYTAIEVKCEVSRAMRISLPLHAYLTTM
jgi:hypothetical protein